MKTLVVTLLWCLTSTSLFAELKYTVRLEARKVEALVAPDPQLLAAGAKILQAIVPGDSVEMTVIAGDGVARVTWNKAMPGIPAGAALLLRKDGSRVLIDPARQVYWRVGLPDLYALGASDRPVVTQTPRTESDVIAGHRATRSSVEIAIPFREAVDGMMVSGTPTSLPLTGDVWVTDRFAGYATRRLRPIHGLALMGLDVAPPETLVLRQILHGPLFGDREVESLVLSMVEEEAPETLFEVPAGFRQVPAPRTRR